MKLPFCLTCAKGVVAALSFVFFLGAILALALVFVLALALEFSPGAASGINTLKGSCWLDPVTDLDLTCIDINGKGKCKHMRKSLLQW